MLYTDKQSRSADQLIWVSCRADGVTETLNFGLSEAKLARRCELHWGRGRLRQVHPRHYLWILDGPQKKPAA